jgi:hypothetical protein
LLPRAMSISTRGFLTFGLSRKGKHFYFLRILSTKFMKWSQNGVVIFVHPRILGACISHSSSAIHIWSQQLSCNNISGDRFWSLAYPSMFQKFQVAVFGLWHRVRIPKFRRTLLPPSSELSGHGGRLVTTPFTLQRFWGPCCLHLQSEVTLKIEAA